MGAGASQGRRAAGGLGAFHAAAMEGDLKRVHKLLGSKSLDVNEAEAKTGNVALHYAAAKGHLEVVKTLLTDPRTDPNRENLHNTTPLILAAGNGQVEVVEELLACNRTNPDFESILGITALRLACQRGKEAVVRVLLDCPKCNPNAKSTKGGHTAMHIAAHAGRIGVLEILRNHPRVRSSLQNEDGKTAEDIFEERHGEGLMGRPGSALSRPRSARPRSRPVSPFGGRQQQQGRESRLERAGRSRSPSPYDPDRGAGFTQNSSRPGTPNASRRSLRVQTENLPPWDQMADPSDPDSPFKQAMKEFLQSSSAEITGGQATPPGTRPGTPRRSYDASFLGTFPPQSPRGGGGWSAHGDAAAVAQATAEAAAAAADAARDPALAVEAAQMAARAAAAAAQMVAGASHHQQQQQLSEEQMGYIGTPRASRIPPAPWTIEASRPNTAMSRPTSARRRSPSPCSRAAEFEFESGSSSQYDQRPWTTVPGGGRRLSPLPNRPHLSPRRSHQEEGTIFSRGFSLSQGQGQTQGFDNAKDAFHQQQRFPDAFSQRERDQQQLLAGRVVYQGRDSLPNTQQLQHQRSRQQRVPYNGPGAPWANQVSTSGSCATENTDNSFSLWTPPAQSQCPPQTAPVFQNQLQGGGSRQMQQATSALNGVSEYEKIALQYREQKASDPLSESAAEYESAWWNSITTTLQQQDATVQDIVNEITVRAEQNLSIEQKIQLQHQQQMAETLRVKQETEAAYKEMQDAELKMQKQPIVGNASGDRSASRSSEYMAGSSGHAETDSGTRIATTNGGIKHLPSICSTPVDLPRIKTSASMESDSPSSPSGRQKANGLEYFKTLSARRAQNTIALERKREDEAIKFEVDEDWAVTLAAAKEEARKTVERRNSHLHLNEETLQPK